MDFKVSFTKLLAVCVVFGYCIQQQSVIACDSVDILILLDGTNHMTQDLNELQTTAVADLIHTLPEGSTISVVRVGDRSTDIILQQQLDHKSIKQSLKSVSHQPTLGNTISGPFLQQLIPKYFANKILKDRAQLVVLMTSNNVDGFNTGIIEGIRTKITFVVGIGTTTLSDHLNNLAADKGHVAFLNDSRGVDDLTSTFSQLMCKDSDFVCDTGHYKIHNIKKCIPCDNICTSTLQSQSPACKKYCPYHTPPVIRGLQVPPRVAKVIEHPTGPPFNDATEKQSPNSNSNANTVGGIVAAGLAVLVLVFVLVLAYKKKLICKTDQANVHDTNAAMETTHSQQEGARGSNPTQATHGEDGEHVRLTPDEVFKNQYALIEPMHDLSGDRLIVESEDVTTV